MVNVSHNLDWFIDKYRTHDRKIDENLIDLPKRRYLLHPPTSILTEAHKQENIFIVFLFFSFLFFDFRSIQLRWINPWEILNANATIISSTGEYLWQRKGKDTRAPFLPELLPKLFDGFSVGKSRDSFSILPFVKQNEENEEKEKE